MAIMLDTAPYCEECEAFEPDATVNKYSDYDKCECKTDTIVSCVNKKKCGRMYQHAKSFVEKEYAAKSAPLMK